MYKLKHYGFSSIKKYKIWLVEQSKGELFIF